MNSIVDLFNNHNERFANCAKHAQWNLQLHHLGVMLGYKISPVLISDIFFDKFIVKVKSNISLRDYLESLKEYHIRVDGYDKWLMLRPHLFNFADFETETGNEKHFTVSKMYEIIFGLEQFSKVQINPQNDSIVKFNTYLNLANKQAESSKPTAQ